MSSSDQPLVGDLSPAVPTTTVAPVVPVSANFIPDNKPPRTLVLCFDGTGDQFDADNSNVVQLFSLLKKDDKSEQMVYYQAGIGTYTNPGIATPFMAKISKTLDEMIAWNLDSHVMGGYEFLMQNYVAGDKICLFGFSRGAYTARALAGMIHKVGLLPAYNFQQVPFAYKMFTRTDEVGWQQSTAFKKAFSIDVDIEFIGVWDTIFRHAVALDERRAKFKANLFNRPNKGEAKLGTQPGEMPKSSADDTTVITEKGVTEEPPQKSPMNGVGRGGKHANGNGKKRKVDGEHSKQRRMEREFSRLDGQLSETDVLEVWFSGCHCDIGGGSVSNDTPHSLARIPLRWMIRQCFLTNTGIRFHTDLLWTVGLNPASLWPVVKERPPALTNADASSIHPPLPASAIPSVPSHSRSDTSTTLVDDTMAPPLPIGGGSVPRLTEEEEDLLDSRCEIYDQLSLAPSWWILEVLPMEQRQQRDDNLWDIKPNVNFGHGRVVPRRVQRHGLHIHRSVKTRLEATDLTQGRYKPKAQFTCEPVWVD